MRCSFEKCMLGRNNLYQDTISSEEGCSRREINGRKLKDVAYGVKGNLTAQLFKGNLCTFSVESLDLKFIYNWQD